MNLVIVCEIKDVKIKFLKTEDLSLKFVSNLKELSSERELYKMDAVIILLEDSPKSEIKKISRIAEDNHTVMFVVYTFQHPTDFYTDNVENLLIIEVPQTTIDNALINNLIANTGLFLKRIIRQENANLELRKRLAELNSIGIALSSEKNLDRLLDMILTELRSFTNADAGSLYIVEDNKLLFKIAHNDSVDKKLMKELGQKKMRSVTISSDSISGYVASTKKLLNIRDVRNISLTSPYKHDASFDGKLGYTTRSILAVPMMDNQGELIGIIQLINALDQNRNFIPFNKTLESLVASLASQAAVSINNAKLINEQDELINSIIEYSASLMDARSRHTAGHSLRVSYVVIEIAKAINRSKKPKFKKIFFSEDEMKELRFAALLHDIGKIGVPESILDKSSRLDKAKLEKLEWKLRYISKLLSDSTALNEEVTVNNEKILADNKSQYLDFLSDFWKSLSKINTEEILNQKYERVIERGKQFEVVYKKDKIALLEDEEARRLSIKYGNLSEEERAIINNHINITIDILNTLPFPKYLSNVALYAGMHHERLDGSGYPGGLKSKDIPLQSRIIAIADFIDAISAPDRPYREGISLKNTLNKLKQEAEKGLYDKNITELLIEGIENKSIKIPWYKLN